MLQLHTRAGGERANLKLIKQKSHVHSNRLSEIDDERLGERAIIIIYKHYTVNIIISIAAASLVFSGKLAGQREAQIEASDR